jgi:eukaryotic-like serine/threonine-protein kinase
MGEVYRARDTRLNREVAIKVLPDAFAADAERLARFEREAQVLASINHPHIAHVYGVEQRALVMELVEGENLADRIARGPIALDEAVEIARQIADGLAAAHERGIVHRDLKPANVRITPEGIVKVLDFGLARVAEAKTGSAHDLSLSPTITSPVLATGIGVLLGTAVYMSPEQARGRVADRRADVWAFGCVLYEMLTGRRAFDGEGITETLAAVLMKEPDWSALPPGVPQSLRRLIQRCLRKDPRQRLQDLGDARLELEESLADAPAIVAPPVPMRRARTWLPWAVSAVLLVVLAGAVWTLRTPAVAPSSVRFAVLPPAGTRIPNDGGTLATLSPDGQRIAMSIQAGAGRHIYLRQLDTLEARPIPGADGAAAFFSPDGRALAFLEHGALLRIGIDGGTPLKLTDPAWGTGDWGADGTIVYNTSYASGLWRVSANGGTPEKLTDPDTKSGELGHWYPQFLPGGKQILFTLFHTPADDSRIAVYSLETRKITEILRGGFFARYTTSGHLLYTRGSTVMAVAFDPGTLKTSGAAVPVIEGVATSQANGVAQFSVAANGTLAYLTAAALNAPLQLATISPTGAIERATDVVGAFYRPAVSPDGQRIALEKLEPEPDIWVLNRPRGTLTRLTYSAGTETKPKWSADGRRILFAHEEPLFRIYARSADAATPPERLLEGQEDQLPEAVTPDGQFLIFQQGSTTTRSDLWLLPLTGDRTPRPLVQTPFDDEDAAVSPDGRWLAYVSNETGKDEIYVQAFPGGGDRVQVSTGGGNTPRWGKRGFELFYSGVDTIVSVTLTPGPPLRVSRPVIKVQAPLASYDTLPDGGFFAVLRDPQAPSTPAYVVTNWFDELRRKVAGR